MYIYMYIIYIYVCIYIYIYICGGLTYSVLYTMWVTIGYAQGW